MKILMATSEVVPFSKTGGLADVCGALPVALENLGHDVCVFSPAYLCAKNYAAEHSLTLEETKVEFEIPIGDNIVEGRLLKTTLPNSQVTVYLVDQPDYYERDGLYGDVVGEYPDNCERYVFFCRSVLESVRLLSLTPDLIHANDWQTGLIPALLKIECAKNPLYAKIRSLITIHNLAYQGVFWHEQMPLTGIDWEFFNWQQMECNGNLNLLKTGLVFADAINTVSPTYAREIQRPEQGCGLDGLLQSRKPVLSGILNGIDDSKWSPATDDFIATQFDATSVKVGKPLCKAALQKRYQLDESPGTPLIGIVGRLASQKGWSLILPVMRKWLESLDVQWVVLGTGDPDFHHVLNSLHRSFPRKLGLTLGFSNELAHQIEAGADMFLMPSEYEPCGLNQMYSMAYGTIPVVRRTGGLADTVADATEASVENGTANGFSFKEFTAKELESTLELAVDVYRHQPDVWQQLIQTGMQRDWSWKSSARRYVELYEKVVAGGTSV